MIRSFFRCVACGHLTPYRAGKRGIVAHNNKVHDGRGKFEQTAPAPGHALLHRRFTDDWEHVDLQGSTVTVESVYVTRCGEGPWTLLILLADGTYFLHGEWGSRSTAETKRLEFRKTGRAGR